MSLLSGPPTALSCSGVLCENTLKARMLAEVSEVETSGVGVVVRTLEEVALPPAGKGGDGVWGERE